MARIPEEELERIKRETSLVELVEARGVKLRRHGRDLVGLCPFHDDREPSLVVSVSKNLWHCLGACGEGGSVIDWVMKAEGVSFRHAVEVLRSEVVPSGNGDKPVKVSTVQKLPPLLAEEASDRKLVRQVVDYYHETLLESREAREYLASRGLGSAELAERFHLGYANRTLGYRLPNKQRAAGERIRGRLQELGILRASGHEHFNGCIVVPVLGEEGEVVELYGRKITKALRKGTALHLYLPGPHRGVWNLGGLGSAKEVILCEALLDAMTFWCAGYRNVTASYGTQGFTEEHLEAFRRLGVERVWIAYDRDEAGERAAQKLAERLLAEGIGAYRVQFPRGLDANAYALKVEPASKSLGLVLRHARWMGEGEAPRVAVRALVATVHTESPEPSSAETTSLPPSQPVASDPPPPTPAPAMPSRPEIPTETKGEEVTLRLGDRRYRVRGLGKNLSYEVLRINLLASRGEGFHVDTLDLYSARQRAAYVRLAAEEMGVSEEVVKSDLGKVLLALEELQEAQIRRALEPEEEVVVSSDGERREALALLEDPGLLDRIPEDLERCGLVGEETNKLLGYLAAVSRKLERPLAVLIQSSTAAGKSALMEGILSLMPEEERVQYSAMTGQSLFYMGEADLKHKILAIAEEEGAERASYALKLLQSEGTLTIASTGKDPQTGRLVTHEYRVEGPVMLMSTTTAIDIDEELRNRCLILAVDESREQTRAIHRAQRKSRTLEGFYARQDRESLHTLHRNAQRLLRPLPVVNPFAERLSFLDESTRTRRDQEKYLSLIEAIALVRQYQRPTKTVDHRGQSYEVLEVTVDDIATANRLAHEVLGRTLDELPPQTRRFLDLVHRMVSEGCERLGVERSDYRFRRRDARQATGWSDFQVKKHLARLVELEYVLVHRGGRGQSFVYELLYDGEGEEGESFLMGLLDVATLVEPPGYDGNVEPPGEDLEPLGVEKERPKSPQEAPEEPRSSLRHTRQNRPPDKDVTESTTVLRQNTRPGARPGKTVVKGGRAGAAPPFAARVAGREE